MEPVLDFNFCSALQASKSNFTFGNFPVSLITHQMLHQVMSEWIFTSFDLSVFLILSFPLGSVHHFFLDLPFFMSNGDIDET